MKKDWERAEALLQRAVIAGHSSALYHLACLYISPKGDDAGRSDIPKAVTLLQKSIDRHEDKHAMFKLAMIYKDGYDGAPGDSAKAAALFQRAVDEGGHLHAMLELSLVLRGGADGVDRNQPVANELLLHIDSRIQVGPHDVDVDAANPIIDTHSCVFRTIQQERLDFWSYVGQKTSVTHLPLEPNP